MASFDQDRNKQEDQAAEGVEAAEGVAGDRVQEGAEAQPGGVTGPQASDVSVAPADDLTTAADQPEVMATDDATPQASDAAAIQPVEPGSTADLSPVRAALEQDADGDGQVDQPKKHRFGKRKVTDPGISDGDATDPKVTKRRKRRLGRDKKVEGVVRIEDLEEALADQDADDIDPDAIVSMYMPKRRMQRIGSALLRMDKLQKGLLALVLVFAVLFAMSFMQENMGNFTINLNRLELFRRGVAIADNADFNGATARLTADAISDGTNIAAEDLPSNLDDVDGSHNGKNYVAYTFYIRNAGKTDLDYSAKLKIVSASKGVEKAARVKVWRNGEPTVYAAAAKDGNPEPDTTPFASKDTVTTIEDKNFRVGDVDKYTVVIWLDGDDPECVDKIIGGAVEFAFDFDSSEEDDSSLFVKFVEDIADTLTGHDPISASGNDAPDYYKKHNVTWHNRRNQTNSPTGDGDKK